MTTFWSLIYSVNSSKICCFSLATFLDTDDADGVLRKRNVQPLESTPEKRNDEIATDKKFVKADNIAKFQLPPFFELYGVFILAFMGMLCKETSN